MTNNKLIIYKCPNIYKILYEIKRKFKFNLIFLEKKKDLEFI